MVLPLLSRKAALPSAARTSSGTVFRRRLCVIAIYAVAAAHYIKQCVHICNTLEIKSTKFNTPMAFMSAF